MFTVVLRVNLNYIADIEITTTPKVYVNVEATDVTKNEVELTVKDFVNTQEGVNSDLNTNLSAPTNLQAPQELITPTTINLTWDAVEGATSYDIDIDGVIFRNITATEYKKIDLEFDTVYKYRVRSVNSEGYSEWSDYIEARTKLDPYTNVPKDMVAIWEWGNYGTDYLENAVDNDDSTRFMYAQRDGVDKEFIINMNGEYDLERIDVLCRDINIGSGNGGVLRAEIYTSVDGENYELVYSNAEETGLPVWVNEGKYNVAMLEEVVKARYIKIVPKETLGGYISFKEIRPIAVAKSVEVPEEPEIPVVVVKDHLNLAVEIANEVTEEELLDVVPAVVVEFKEALDAANAILENENSTQEEVDSAFERLANAMQMLEFIKGDKTQLINLLDRIEGLNSDEYINDTWSKLHASVEKANAVIADENALEAEVADSYKELLRSFLELRLKPSKDKLEGLINKVEALDASKYTIESWNNLQAKLGMARGVFENEEATVAEISNAENELNAAFNALVANVGTGNEEVPENPGNTENPDNNEVPENPGTTETPTNPDKNEVADNTEKTEDKNENVASDNVVSGSSSSSSNSSSATNTTSQSQGKDNLPKTGGVAGVLATTIGAILAGAGAILSKKRR